MFLSSFGFLSSLTVLWISGFADGCQNEAEKINEICNVHFDCQGQVHVQIWIKDQWSCIRHSKWETYYDYSYYQYPRQREVVTYDSDYNIYLTVNDANAPFISDMDESQLANVRSLNITSGKLEAMPSITGLTNIEEFKVTGNLLNKINLYDFTLNKHLNLVNFSHNEITTFVYNSSETYEMSNIETIDISYNLIKVIPSMYFTKFPNLHYLDLSYNLISNLDVLTFEGLPKLQTLCLHHNNIVDLGASLLRFQYLKRLRLDNNDLNYLSKPLFEGLKNIEIFNVSYNIIENLDTNTFSDMAHLNDLDISYNKIKYIQKGLFENNMMLKSLSLAFNAIEEVEQYSFDKQNFTNFDIRGNVLKGLLKPNIFQGISQIKSLELSNGLITTIVDDTFDDARNVKYLNLSHNLIFDLSTKCFLSFQLLETLDLSHNNLTKINLSNNNLTKLSWLSLRNNHIKLLNENALKNLISLTYLDLSFNKITTIEPGCFVSLMKLEYIYLDHNDLKDNLLNNSMKGLEKVNTLNLSGFRFHSIENNSFSGMNSLQYLNMSNGVLSEIEYEAFAETDSVIFLDLSHNLLESFHVNTTYLQQLQTLYLNENKLVNITAFTFDKLENLLTLNISNNKLVYVDPNSLLNVRKLTYFDMSFNEKVKFDGVIFKNLTYLLHLNLSNIENNFTFVNSTNTAISNLIISSNKIQNLENICFFTLIRLNTLYANANEIIKINKKSFSMLSNLVSLDLSKNLISDIEPGSFDDTLKIETMNLSFNDISQLKYGVFDGLLSLYSLDLSDNKIHYINGYFFHNTPRITELLLDNNNIENIDIKSFNITKIKELSIGGNAISCQMLVDFYNNPQQSELRLVTARKDFRNENVRGISCRGLLSVYNDLLANSSTAVSSDHVSLNATVQFYVIANALKSLQDTVKNVNLKRIVDLLDEHDRRETAENKNLDKIVDFIEIQNNISSDVAHANNLSLNAFIQSSENITFQLKEITKVVNRSLSNINFKQERTSDPNKTEKTPNNPPINDMDLKKMIINYMETEKINLIRELENKILSLRPENDAKSSEKLLMNMKDNDNDTKSQLIYVVCTCLVFVVFIMFIIMIFLIYRIKFSNSSSNHLQRQRIIDSMEMN